jgi:hypothetical protein
VETLHDRVNRRDVDQIVMFIAAEFAEAGEGNELEDSGLEDDLLAVARQLVHKLPEAA